MMAVEEVAACTGISVIEAGRGATPLPKLPVTLSY